MKKLILALAACGIIAGSGILWASSVSADEEKKDIQALATDSSVLAITNKHSVSQSSDILERWLLQQPENAPGLTSVKEDAEAAQQRANTGDKIHQQQTAQDWALYYSSGCEKTTEGCCITVERVDGKIVCTDHDHKTLEQRRQRMEEVCKEQNNSACNKTLLEELEHIESLSDFERQNLVQARAHEARERVYDFGYVYTSTEGTKYELLPNSAITPTSQAVRDASSAAKENNNITPEDDSALRTNDAYTRQLISDSQKSEQELRDMGADEERIQAAKDLHEKVGDLTEQEQEELADAIAEQQLKYREQRQADILRKVREQIEKEADERRKRRLKAVANELEAIQKSLSGSMDCKGNECYKVYDVGDKNGKSVTNGQTMSEYIDIR